MRANSFFLAASAAAIATAQDLATVLAGQESLSTLVELLGQVPNTTEFLASQEGVTLFAPNNNALATIVGSGGIFSIEEAAVDPGLIEQILRYHLYRGVIRAEDITEIPEFVSSFLNYSGIVLDGEVSGSNVTGGQVVSVSLDEEGNAIVTAGIKVPSTVTVADLEFDNGVIHIIDKLLLIPLTVSATLIAGGFTALAGAATQVDLVKPLEELSDVTIFCPNNDAFQKIASGSGDITDEQLAKILEYHVVQGTVGYSTALSNTSLPTLNGKEVEITITDDGAVFVNSARVINADVLIANGVLHVIDEVLNPARPDAQPNENDSSYPATSVGTVVPFTSGIQPETSIYSELTQTTSFVAAGLMTATPTMANAPGHASVTTSGVVMQTGNSGARNELPALAAAAMGAVVFAINV
ncbi:hypothetical protein LTR37_008031 [Vermiconidia calcicola]|uniref:Uncharacterized protein n=1 Tax=Vermiconidia calcicola TaxID=1690605 RepID=A0ACC3NDB4_9PEZI|nr:hypothetical protein LTR37_008031 [Vermiconidia calcicola]